MKDDSNKKCGESCACSNSKNNDNYEPQPAKISKNQNNSSQEEVKVDPTRFGDWEIGGRAIDF